MLQKGDRLIDIAYHLRGIKNITHTIECDRWQRWLQPLHDSQHDAIFLNIKPLFGLDIAELPRYRINQRLPSMALQKIVRPVAIDSPHIDIEKASGSGDSTVHRAQYWHLLWRR